MNPDFSYPGLQSHSSGTPVALPPHRSSQQVKECFQLKQTVAIVGEKQQTVNNLTGEWSCLCVFLG